MFFGGLLSRYRLLFGNVSGHGGGVVALDAPFGDAQLGGVLGVAFGALAVAVAGQEDQNAENDEQQEAGHLAASRSETPWLVTTRSTALPAVSRSTAQP